MIRSLTLICAASLLSACMSTPSGPAGDAKALLSDSRVTFLPPDPEGGPIIMEFYADGTALMVFDEVAERGHTPMVWRVDGSQLCVAPTQPRRNEECTEFTLRGSVLTLGNGTDMNGTIASI